MTEILRTSDREILDAVTLLLRKAREAKNGTARDFDGGELSGFVLPHHVFMRLHCLLNIVQSAGNEAVDERPELGKAEVKDHSSK